MKEGAELVFVDLEERGIGHTVQPKAWRDPKVKVRTVEVPKPTAWPLRYDGDVSAWVQNWVEDKFAIGDEFEE